MKTKSFSIFLVALFVVGMNLGAEENNNENKKGENFEYKIMKEDIHESDFNLSLKAILIGNSNVGKSALIEKICKDNFSEDLNPTIGFEFRTLYFKIKSGEDEPVLKYQMWDCSGQEIYKSLFQNFFTNARVCLLAYNVTNEKSFNDIENWVNDVKTKNTDEPIHFVLIGNKIDLEDKRVVPKEKGENFAKEKGMEFVEVSAKTDAGIKDLEKILAKIIYEEFKKKNVKDENDEKNDFVKYKKDTYSSSLCDCCKKICENC